MTDRLNGVIVTFDHPIRDDDAESIIAAIRQLRGVISVNPIIAGSANVTGAADSYAAAMRADIEWAELLDELIQRRLAR